MAPQYLYNVYTQTILFSTILGRVCDEMELRLAALIEAIFVIMGTPDTTVRQCPLALDKWLDWAYTSSLE
jgi:hypothetical protein